MWTSVQSPQAAHDLCAKALGLAPEKVKVNVTLLGGGFGRKSKPDFAVEAAIVAKEMNGIPVKVVWTREDDIQNGFYHTVSMESTRGGLGRIRQNRGLAAQFHRSDYPVAIRARSQTRDAA